MHLVVDALDPRGETGDELLDRFPSLHGIHRNVVIDAVFGEVAGQFLGVGLGPLLAEFGHQFVG